MEQYVNIMLDRGFKAVFGNKQVAIDFIHAAYGFGTINAKVPELAHFYDLPKLLEQLSRCSV